VAIKATNPLFKTLSVPRISSHQEGIILYFMASLCHSCSWVYHGQKHTIQLQIALIILYPSTQTFTHEIIQGSIDSNSYTSTLGKKTSVWSLIFGWVILQTSASPLPIPTQSLTPYFQFWLRLITPLF
jgi:hypothetical protein